MAIIGTGIMKLIEAVVAVFISGFSYLTFGISFL